MIKRKTHKYRIHTRKKWYITEKEHWNVLLLEQTRSFWILPTYTVLVLCDPDRIYEDKSQIISGVTEAALR